MSRPGNASRYARIPLFVLVVLLACGSIGSFVMASRARAHAQDLLTSQARSAVSNTLSSIFSGNDLSSMSSPSRAATLNDQLSVALGGTAITDVTLFNTAGTIIYDTQNAKIGNKMLGERGPIKTAIHGGSVPAVVGSDFTIVLPVRRFGTQGAVMLTMDKAPIDAAARPWTAAALIMALAILPALVMLWWVGRIADSAGANISFRPQALMLPPQSRVLHEPLRPVVHDIGRRVVSPPQQHGLKEEADARRMAEERARAAEERLSVLQEQYRKTLEELHAVKDTTPASGSDPALEERALAAEGKLRLVEGQLRAITEERDKLEGALRSAPASTAGPEDEAARSRLEDELTGLRAELEGSQTQLAAARQQLARAAEETQRADADRTRELEENLDAAHVQILTTRESLEQAQAQVERFSSQTAEMHARLASLTTERDEAVRDRDTMLLQSREEVEGLLRELAAATAAAGEERDAVHALADRAKALEADLGSARAEASRAREELAAAQEATASHAAALEEAQGEVERLGAQVAGGGQEVEGARGTIAAQTGRIRELQQQLEATRSDVLRAEERASLAEGRSTDARGELEATRKELRALRNEEQRAAMLEDELRAKVAEVENLRASQRAELVERDADLEERVRRIRQEFQAELATTGQQLGVRTSELAAARAELTQARAEIAAADEEAHATAAQTAELADRTERAERELAAQQAAVRRTASDLQEAVAANAELARKLQDLENRRQLELADEEGQLEMDQILHATQERLAGQTERLIEMEERAHAAERDVAALNERLDETLSQLRSLQMADALRDLRNEEHGQREAVAGQTDGEEVVRLEDRRASSPFLKELTLDAKKSLTQILGITQILKYKKDAKDQAQLVKQLTAYARRLDLTVSDLADADKLARGSIELTVRRTDMEALVQRVVSESDVGANHDVRVVTEALVCGVDQLRTEQLLAGLLRSSADRTPQGKSILVTLQHVEGGALISVGDPEPSSEGSLSPVVKRFAEIQGGWAKVDTREDGTGSMFRIFLPDGGIDAAAAEGTDLRIVVGGEDANDWDAESDMLVREIGRLAEPG